MFPVFGSKAETTKREYIWESVAENIAAMAAIQNAILNKADREPNFRTPSTTASTPAPLAISGRQSPIAINTSQTVAAVAVLCDVLVFTCSRIVQTRSQCDSEVRMRNELRNSVATTKIRHHQMGSCGAAVRRPK